MIIISNYLIQQFNLMNQQLKLFQRDGPSQGDSLVATFHRYFYAIFSFPFVFSDCLSACAVFVPCLQPADRIRFILDSSDRGFSGDYWFMNNPSSPESVETVAFYRKKSHPPDGLAEMEPNQQALRCLVVLTIFR